MNHEIEVCVITQGGNLNGAIEVRQNLAEDLKNYFTRFYEDFAQELDLNPRIYKYEPVDITVRFGPDEELDFQLQIVSVSMREHPVYIVEDYDGDHVIATIHGGNKNLIPVKFERALQMEYDPEEWDIKDYGKFMQDWETLDWGESIYCEFVFKSEGEEYGYTIAVTKVLSY